MSNVQPLRPDPPRPPSGGNGGGNLSERLARLEARFDSEIKHLATKEDLQLIKVWLVGTVSTAVIAIVGLVVTAIKIF